MDNITAIAISALRVETGTTVNTLMFERYNY